MKTTTKPQGKLKSFLNISGAGVFWFWNLAFLLVIYGGLLPTLGTAFWLAGLQGDIQREFLFVFVAILLIPLASVAIASLTFSLQPNKLIRLFYGLEAPLILLLLIRLLALRELTPASHLVLGTLLICLLGFFLELVNGYAEENRLVASLQLGIHTLMVLAGLGMATLLAFYTIPIGAFIWRGFWSFYWLEAIWRVFTYGWESSIEFLLYGPAMLLLFGLTATLFVLMPLFWVIFYVNSGTRVIKRFSSDYGQKAAIAGVLGVLTAWFILFAGFNQQPQTKVFTWFNKPPQTDGDKTALLKKSSQIRSGLVNAYLSSYRYLSPVEDSNSLMSLYRDAFYLEQPTTQIIQNCFNTLLSPFLYQGSSGDSTKAAEIYEYFFDLPIQKGEKEAIRHALKSTIIIDEAKAGVLNIDEKRVWLRSQDIQVKPHNGWADVELYEVYENQTNDVEEILYYFSLPESAVITGVWLGDNADRNKRFTFQVSPRGAAQKVYNSQVRRQRPVDPALLEQVGPRNYRLRAFPVPPRLPLIQQESPEAPTEMHLWLTYKVMQQPEGWAMPKLAERRNIFWTKATQRLQNGKKVKGDRENWLPTFLPAQKPYQPQKQEISLSEGYRLTASPLAEKDYASPQKESLAIILDSSRSMGENSQAVEETVTWLRKNGFQEADLYLTTTGDSQPQRLDNIRGFQSKKQIFFGKLQLKEMLQQFAQLQGDASYDSIILLTDASNYELADDSKNVPAMRAPLWVVHLGDSLAPAYDDPTLKAIQDSQGGVATDLPEVLIRAATQAELGSSNVVDGYSWSIAPSPAKITTSLNFAPLASRQLIKNLSAQTDGNSIKELDAIHGLAKKYAVVTPYSSMIVLVNDEQRKALKEAEASEDRFDRTVEDGREELNQPGNPLNNTSDVPEPGLILAVIMTIPFAIIFRRYKLKATTDISQVAQESK